MKTFEQTMARQTEIAEREELCVEFGFRNRWTAKLYQWAFDEFGPVPDDVGIDVAAADLRAWAESRGIHESRLWNVDFAAIALALQAG
jgi:hypothetical protein